MSNHHDRPQNDLDSISNDLEFGLVLMVFRLEKLIFLFHLYIFVTTLDAMMEYISKELLVSILDNLRDLVNF